MRVVVVNGNPTTPETAQISVYDRGFLYGDSVFETLRTYGGKPFGLDEHLARLSRSAARVFIPLPETLPVIAAEIVRGIAIADNPESVVRVMLTRGTGPLGLDPDLAKSPNRVIFVEPLVLPPPEAYENGVEAILVRTARATDDTAAAGAKVGNYLASLLAMKEARQRGAAEALFVDARGRVLEGTTSNVFLVKEGTLVTPPEESGILAGITRAHLLGAAERLGIGVAVRDIEEAELFDADELFISSSIREVLALVRVEGRTIGAGRPGSVTGRVHAELRRYAVATAR